MKEIDEKLFEELSKDDLDEEINESSKDEKKELRYLRNKEKVCSLDKEERYRLQSLIQKHGKLEDSLDEEKLDEGTSNFPTRSEFPLYVFYTIDEFYSYMHNDSDYPQESEFEKEDENGEFYIDWDAYEQERETFEQKYWDENNICVLDEDELDRLEDKLYDFNKETENIANNIYDSEIDDYDNDDYYALKDIKLDIASGYYSGAYIDVDGEEQFKYMSEKLAQEQYDRFNKFLKEVAKEFGLTKLGLAWGPASNGETGFKVIKDEDESLKKSYKDNLKEGVEFIDSIELGTKTIGDGPYHEGDGVIYLLKDGDKYYAEYAVENENGPIEDPEYLEEVGEHASIEELKAALKEHNYFKEELEESHTIKVKCIKDYMEDDSDGSDDEVAEIWSKGDIYDAKPVDARGNREIKTNHGNWGVVGPDYLLNDFDKYFEIVDESLDEKKSKKKPHERVAVGLDLAKDTAMTNKMLNCCEDLDSLDGILKELKDAIKDKDSKKEKSLRGALRRLGMDDMTQDLLLSEDFDVYDTDSYYDDEDICIYQFPASLKEVDFRKAKEYGLELLGKVNDLGMQPGDPLIKGTYANLKKYCEEYLDYVMHPYYLYKEGDIDLEDILEPVDASWEKAEALGEEVEDCELEIEYWYDEESRDQGLGDYYFGDVPSIEEGKRLVRKMIDREGYASAELQCGDRVIFGYDGVDTWGDEKEESLKENKDEAEISYICIVGKDNWKVFKDKEEAKKFAKENNCKLVRKDIKYPMGPYLTMPVDIEKESLEEAKKEVYIVIGENADSSEVVFEGTREECEKYVERVEKEEAEIYGEDNPDTFEYFIELKESLNESMKSEVTNWWKDVEDANREMKWEINIDNGDYSDVEAMHAAMFDMLDELDNRGAGELFKRGKKIYNKYAKFSKYNEDLKESCSDKELVDKLVAFGTCDSEEEAEKRVAKMSQETKDAMCKSLKRQAMDHLLNDSLKEEKECSHDLESLIEDAFWELVDEGNKPSKKSVLERVLDNADCELDKKEAKEKIESLWNSLTKKFNDDLIANGAPKEDADVYESLNEDNEVARVEYCVMDNLNNNIECFDNTDDAIAFAKDNEGVRVLEVKYGPKNEHGDEPELGCEEVWSIRENLEEEKCEKQYYVGWAKYTLDEIKDKFKGYKVETNTPPSDAYSLVPPHEEDEHYNSFGFKDDELAKLLGGVGSIVGESLKEEKNPKRNHGSKKPIDESKYLYKADPSGKEGEVEANSEEEAIKKAETKLAEKGEYVADEVIDVEKKEESLEEDKDEFQIQFVDEDDEIVDGGTFDNLEDAKEEAIDGYHSEYVGFVIYNAKGDIVFSEDDLEESLEEGKTSAQRYNDNMNAIFRTFKDQNEKMAKFLLDHGVSQEEVDELKANTGLHGNALHQKLIDLELDDEFFERKQECKESISAWSIKANEENEEIEILVKKNDVWESIASIENCPTKDMLKEDIVKEYSKVAKRVIKESGYKLMENDLYSLHVKVLDTHSGKPIKVERLMTGSRKECVEKKKQLEETSPEDSYHNKNVYTVSKVK